MNHLNLFPSVLAYSKMESSSWGRGGGGLEGRGKISSSEIDEMTKLQEHLQVSPGMSRVVLFFKGKFGYCSLSWIIFDVSRKRKIVLGRPWWSWLWWRCLILADAWQFGLAMAWSPFLPHWSKLTMAMTQWEIWSQEKKLLNWQVYRCTTDFTVLEPRVWHVD